MLIVSFRRLLPGISFEFAENHFSGGRLKRACYRDDNIFADFAAGLLDNHHRAVVEITDTLLRFFARLYDANLHIFSGQGNGLERVGQVVYIQDVHLSHGGNLAEVIIRCYESSAAVLGEGNQLLVNTLYAFDVRHNGVVDGYINVGFVCISLSISRPRLPRLRFSLSAESEINCISFKTNRGTISGESNSLLLYRSAIRPSIIAEVSSTKGLAPLVCFVNSTYGITKRTSSFVRMTIVIMIKQIHIPSIHFMAVVAVGLSAIR